MNEEDMYQLAFRLIKEMRASTTGADGDYKGEYIGYGDQGSLLLDGLVNMIRDGKITVNL